MNFLTAEVGEGTRGARYFQDEIGYRVIGKKFNLNKDRIWRVCQKYDNEPKRKDQAAPSQEELEIGKIDQEVDTLRSTAEIQKREEDLERQKLWYSLKTRGNDFVEEFLNRKVFPDCFRYSSANALADKIILRNTWRAYGRDRLLHIYQFLPLSFWPPSTTGITLERRFICQQIVLRQATNALQSK